VPLFQNVNALRSTQCAYNKNHHHTFSPRSQAQILTGLQGGHLEARLRHIFRYYKYSYKQPKKFQIPLPNSHSTLDKFKGELFNLSQSLPSIKCRQYNTAIIGWMWRRIFKMLRGHCEVHSECPINIILGHFHH
jgi:hypothetical protein